MNTEPSDDPVYHVWAQEWEERERGWGARPSGYTLHASRDAAVRYVGDVYRERQGDDEVPDEYDAALGGPQRIAVTRATHDEVARDASAAGRARVLRERRKNVHAVVRGAILDGGQTLRSAPADACSVTYDPYMAGAFTAAGRGVRAAARVWFGADGKVRAAGTEFLP